MHIAWEACQEQLPAQQKQTALFLLSFFFFFSFFKGTEINEG